MFNNNIDRQRKEINTRDWWDLEKIVNEPVSSSGTETAEFAYMVNRFNGDVKKVKIEINQY